MVSMAQAITENIFLKLEPTYISYLREHWPNSSYLQMILKNWLVFMQLYKSFLKHSFLDEYSVPEPLNLATAEIQV